jgi:hypothetical protein
MARSVSDSHVGAGVRSTGGVTTTSPAIGTDPVSPPAWRAGTGASVCALAGPPRHAQAAAHTSTRISAAFIPASNVVFLAFVAEPSLRRV